MVLPSSTGSPTTSCPADQPHGHEEATQSRNGYDYIVKCRARTPQLIPFSCSVLVFSRVIESHIYSTNISFVPMKCQTVLRDMGPSHVISRPLPAPPCES